MKTRTLITVALVHVAITLGVLGSSTTSAHAWLKVCNSTAWTVQYEHTISDSSCGGGDPWRRQQWYVMAPGECKTVSNLSMTNRYFYWFAETSDQTRFWTSDRWSWDTYPYALNVCRVDEIGCSCSHCSTPCDGKRRLNHRETRGTSTNYTMTLTGS
jgi:uncharacterized membrane protein